MHAIDREKVEEINKKENIPVIVVFPTRGDEEFLTLEREIQILQPLDGETHRPDLDRLRGKRAR